MNKPYVYIIQNKNRTHWYVGMRSANESPANEDTKYWGSSKYLKALINKTGKENWTKIIISEFDSPEEASAHEVELLELMWDWDGRVNKAKGGYFDHDDPEVKAKHQTATTISNKKKSQDPVWRANHKAGVQKANENLEYREKKKAAMKTLWQDPEYRANQEAGCKNGAKKRRKPFIATSIATGEEFCCESLYCDQAKALSLTPSIVSRCLNGGHPQHKGFTFRYV